MTEFNYNDIIEYVDGTRDLNFEEARQWCNENNALFLEIAPKDEKTRQFQILEMPYEEKVETVEQTRKQLYIAEVDPLTAHINRLRDEELTPEVAAEIEKLIAQRAEVVARIKEENPYPAVEEAEEPAEAETVVEEPEVVEPSEASEDIVELYSMEI